MGTVLDLSRIPGSQIERSSLVIELVGLAGAGKTTLSRALTRYDPGMVIVPQPYYRDPADLPFFVRNSILSLPLLLHVWRANGIRLRRLDIAILVTLMGWHRTLLRQKRTRGLVSVLDQGPIFMLTDLRTFGPMGFYSLKAWQWWVTTCRQWASTLDLIVWLDAPDTVLLERVNSRDEWHLLKEKSEQEGLAWLSLFRSAYEQTMAALTVSSTPAVLRIDTSREPADQALRSILTAINAIRDGLGRTNDGAY